MDFVDLAGSTILLTGGTGSFGNAFIDRVVRTWPDAVGRV
jgi:FlaA1/EpsC-like NDP-sugar epimerase